MNRYFNSLAVFILLSASLTACSSSVRFSKSGTSEESQNYRSGEEFVGFASYYSDSFDGKRTSCGEIFDNSKFTAAHKTLPFGTKCEVTNLENGRKTIVTINDRGPFVRGRIIDLTRAAATELGMIEIGVVKVRVRVLE